MNITLTVELNQAPNSTVNVAINCTECFAGTNYPQVTPTDLGLVMTAWLKHTHRCRECGFTFGIETMATCGHDSPKIPNPYITESGYT